MRLGLLYRKYLHGSDLDGQVTTVKIKDICTVLVQPHPTIEPREKWCMIIEGLPEELPDKILFGPKGETDLVKIFGSVDIASLKGRHVVLFPYKVRVSNQDKVSIGFRKAENPK